MPNEHLKRRDSTKTKYYTAENGQCLPMINIISYSAEMSTGCMTETDVAIFQRLGYNIDR